jgi:DNA-binding response OmpR family regulator
MLTDRQRAEAGLRAGGADGLPVLIVDDDQVTSRLISGVFEMNGIGPIRRVGTLGEAGRAIATARYRAVVADLHLPDGNGMELVHLLRRGRRSQNREATLIVCSAYARARTTYLILRLGADAVLDKPADPETLLACLARGRRCEASQPLAARPGKI